MPLIQVPQSVRPCQVDVPDSVKDRSRPGSIHMKPGVRRVTQEEWDHIAKVRPELVRQCHVVPVDETQSIGAKKKAEEAKKAHKEAPKPLLDKRAKDHPTKRQRKLAELEAKKAGKAPPAAKPVAPTPQPEPKPEPEATTKDKDKKSKDK